MASMMMMMMAMTIMTMTFVVSATGRVIALSESAMIIPPVVSSGKGSRNPLFLSAKADRDRKVAVPPPLYIGRHVTVGDWLVQIGDTVSCVCFVCCDLLLPSCDCSAALLQALRDTRLTAAPCRSMVYTADATLAALLRHTEVTTVTSLAIDATDKSLFRFRQHEASFRAMVRVLVFTILDMQHVSPVRGRHYRL